MFSCRTTRTQSSATSPNTKADALVDAGAVERYEETFRGPSLPSGDVARAEERRLAARDLADLWDETSRAALALVEQLSEDDLTGRLLSDGQLGAEEFHLELAKALRYEEAARIRDRIRVLEARRLEFVDA